MKIRRPDESSTRGLGCLAEPARQGARWPADRFAGWTAHDLSRQ